MRLNTEVDCYAIADELALTDQDGLFFFSFGGDTVRPIGNGTGTTGIEAMAFAPPETVSSSRSATLSGNRANLQPGNAADTLFAVNGATLGVLDLTSGLFDPIAPISDGAIADIDGLSYDPARGFFWAIERNAAAGEADLLIGIDRDGQVVRPARPIELASDPQFVTAAGEPFDDVDEVAVDPVSGRIFALMNRAGEGSGLVELDVSGAAPQVIDYIGLLSDSQGQLIDDIEGMSFFRDGNLYGTSGTNGPDPGDSDQLWLIDPGNARVESLLSFTDPARDVEAIACYTRTGELQVGPTPTPTATPTSAGTPTPEPSTSTTATPTPTPTSDGTTTPTPTPTTSTTTTPTPTPTSDGTTTPTPTPSTSTTATPTPTPTSDGTATPTPTATSDGTTTPTPTPSTEGPPRGTPPPSDPPPYNPPPPTPPIDTPPPPKPDGPIAYTGNSPATLALGLILTALGATFVVASRRRARNL